MNIAHYLSMRLYPLLNQRYGENTLGEYLGALGIFLGVITLLLVFKSLLLQKLIRLSEKTSSHFDDAILVMIRAYGWPLYVWVGLIVSLQMLVLPPGIHRGIYIINVILGSYYVILSLQKIIQYGVHRLLDKKTRQDDQFDPSILTFFEKIIEGLLYLAGILVVLQNLGFNVTTLLGGLGVGGIAVAFALQNVLADLFASLSIFFDRPFQAGDFVVIGKDMGTVQKIGIKSTRIKTLQGESLVVSNKELTESRVHNYKEMQKRRVAFKFGVTYQTSTKKLQQINTLVSEIVSSIEQVELDRVHFFAFGDSALIFEVVYHILDKDYNLYMDVQQQINLGIKSQLEKADIAFAYPTQTVYIKNSD